MVRYYISPHFNDNIVCFIAFLGVFSTKNGYQKNTKKFRNPGPTPLIWYSFKPLHQIGLIMVGRDSFDNAHPQGRDDITWGD